MSMKSYSSSGENYFMSIDDISSIDFSFDEKDFKILNISNSTILSTTTDNCMYTPN